MQIGPNSALSFPSSIHSSNPQRSSTEPPKILPGVPSLPGPPSVNHEIGHEIGREPGSTTCWTFSRYGHFEPTQNHSSSRYLDFFDETEKTNNVALPNITSDNNNPKKANTQVPQQSSGVVPFSSGQGIKNNQMNGQGEERLTVAALPVKRGQGVQKKRAQKRKRGRRPVDKSGRICFHCSAKVTPEWRKGPNGSNTLCNACGLQYNKVRKADREREQGIGTPRQFSVASLLHNPNSHI